MADITFYKNIPFDPDGSYTMDFLTASSSFSETVRSNYLNASSRLYQTIALGNDVYIRDNVPFRVEINIDKLKAAGVNYFRFRNYIYNENAYSRYYYGFIDKMTLSAADTTVIEWHIDVIQTYLAEIYSDAYEQQIERCHQDRFNSSMQPIFNTFPDLPAGPSKTKILQKIKVGDVGYCILICSSQLDQNSFDNSPRVAPPDIVQNCPNSFYYYIIPFPKNSAAFNGGFYKEDGTTPIFWLGGNNATSSLFKAAAPYVVGMYFSPVPPVEITWTSFSGGFKINHKNGVSYIDGGAAGADVLRITPNGVGISNAIYNAVVAQSGFTGLFNTTIIADNVSLSAYNQSTTRDPLRETKLYTAQYCPIHFSDFSSTVDKLIKNELIPSGLTPMSAGASFSIVGAPTLWVKFVNYNSAIDGITDFKNDTSNELPVVADTFADYFSRNSASSLMSLASVAASGLNFGGVAMATKTPSYSKTIAKQNAAAYGSAAGDFESKAGAGISSLVNLADAYLAPDKAQSVSNSITPRLARGYYDFLYYYDMPINAIEICDFWALYGYPYHKPAKLSDVIKTRYRFNYVKTADAKLPSITYNEHKVKLEQLLNAGITFWHDHAGTIAAIRDYSKENAEISLL